jgi:hypothetical protein
MEKFPGIEEIKSEPHVNEEVKSGDTPPQSISNEEKEKLLEELRMNIEPVSNVPMESDFKLGNMPPVPEMKPKTEDKPETLYDVKVNVAGEVKTQYDLSPEVVLNPGNMPALPETKGIEKREGYVAIFPQTNPATWEVLREHVLKKTMSDEEIDTLAAEMVQEHDVETNSVEEAQTAEIIEEAEEENKQEIAKQEEAKPSIFTRAVEAMKGYLEKHPKIAKLAVVSALAYELGNNPAMAQGEMESMINMGIQGMQQSAYSQSEGYQRARSAQKEGEYRARYAQMEGQHRTQIEYRREMQHAEQARQSEYYRLDNRIMQMRSQSVPENQIAREVYSIRMQIERSYANRSSNAQMRYQENQQEAYFRQQDIQMQTEMQQQQIQMQSQMQRQQIQMNTGAQITNMAIRGVMQGLFHR